MASQQNSSDENVTASGSGEVPFNSETSLYGAIEVEYPSTEDLRASNEALNQKNFGFNWIFVKRFWHIHKLLFNPIVSAVSAMFVMLVMFVGFREWTTYEVGLIASEYYTALSTKDINMFWRHTAKSAGLIVAISFLNATTQFCARVLAACFRSTLTEALHRIYFADIAYYRLNVLDKKIDNPDQRMTQDIDKFCTTYGGTLAELLVSPFTIAYYCWQGYKRAGWMGPVGCFVFFLIATTINKFLMSPVVNWVAKQERREGDFRFCHMLVRVNAESIAFQGGAVLEHEKVNDALGTLVSTQRGLYLRQYFLGFAVQIFDYTGSIVSYLLLAISIFGGEHDDLDPFGLMNLISQNSFVLMYLIFSFTRLIDQAGQMADVAGVTHRICQLLEHLNAMESTWNNKRSSNSDAEPSVLNRCRWADLRKEIGKKLEAPSAEQPTESVPESGAPKLSIWTLENVTLCRPKFDMPLISALNFQFCVGESVIITGASAAGKTSLFRVLRGLWPHSEGRLRSYFPPGPQGVYFCPQRGYLTWGTLREQISFPLKVDKRQNENDKLIHYYAERLKLGPILERVGGLDKPCSWTVFDSLSPGEMQRLCILRVFYHQPVVAVLDEVTSALPVDMEQFIYGEMRRVGITLISVGHRESIRKYHDKQLIIHPKGKWEVKSIEE